MQENTQCRLEEIYSKVSVNVVSSKKREKIVVKKERKTEKRFFCPFDLSNQNIRQEFNKLLTKIRF